MVNQELIKFHIEQNMCDLELLTRKIKHKGVNTNNWFFKDLYEQYKTLKPQPLILIDQMLTIVKGMNNKYVITENKDIKNVIVSKKSSYDEKQVKEILENVNGTIPIKEETSGFKKLDVLYEARSDSESDFLLNPNTKKINNNDLYNKKNQNFRNLNDNYPVKKSYDDNRSKNKNDFYKKETRCRDSNEDIKRINNRNEKLYDPRNDIKSNSSSKRLNSVPDHLKSYADYRKLMLAAFKDSQVFLMTTFHNAINRVRSITFDHKRAPSFRGNYIRSKLSAYLDDCDDIFEKIQIGNTIFFKIIDQETYFLTEKRRNAHLNTQIFSRAELKYHLEVVIVNLFPVKTTTEANHVEIIFEKVYKVPLKKLHGKPNFIDFIKELKSPNIIIKDGSGLIKITCIPTHSDEYKFYGDEDLHDHIIYTEENILRGVVSGLKKISAIVPEKSDKSEIFGGFVPVIKMKDVFKTTDPDLLRLLDIAELSVPRCIQKRNNMMDISGLFKKTQEKYGLDPVWEIIHQNVKLSQERTYFDIN